MQRRRFDDGPELVATAVDRLPAKDAVDHGLSARVHFHTPHHEALDLVHVEALVDPADEQALGRVGLRTNLPMLAFLDLLGPDDQSEHAERRLREGTCPCRPPGAHTHVRFRLEMLPAGIVRAQPATPRSP